MVVHTRRSTACVRGDTICSWPDNMGKTAGAHHILFFFLFFFLLSLSVDSSDPEGVNYSVTLTASIYSKICARISRINTL